MHADITAQGATQARTNATELGEWAVRRRRLERLASLLEQKRPPLRLFSTMECYPRRERLALRQPGSALALAYQDAQFRRDGLAGDRVGDAIEFFKLSHGEAHALLCDCRYGAFSLTGEPLALRVARRARKIAARRSLAEWRATLSAVLLAASTRFRRMLSLGDKAASAG